MGDEMRPLQLTRSCGHSIDAILFWMNPQTGFIEIICVPCLAKAAGLKPAETLTPDEFARKYMGVK